MVLAASAGPIAVGAARQVHEAAASSDRDAVGALATEDAAPPGPRSVWYQQVRLHHLVVNFAGLVLGDAIPDEMARDGVLQRRKSKGLSPERQCRAKMAFEPKTATTLTKGYTLVLVARQAC